MGNRGGGPVAAKDGNGGFKREKDLILSRIPQIRPSEFVGARRKAALPEEVYAWTPILRVFDKLREVGVSSYLGFTLYLSVFQCFG